jgi:hypothetical protein
MAPPGGAPGAVDVRWQQTVGRRHDALLAGLHALQLNLGFEAGRPCLGEPLFGLQAGLLQFADVILAILELPHLFLDDFDPCLACLGQW